MVNSLCRAGTVSAALLNGNQRHRTLPPRQAPLITRENQKKLTNGNRGAEQAKALKKCLSENLH